MNNIYTVDFFKCAVCGFLISVITNILHIIAMYIYYPYWCVYVFSAFIATIILLVIRKNDLKTIFVSIGILFLTNVITEVILFGLGITDYFYFRAHPTACEIDIGDSLFQVYLYLGELAGIVGGYALVVIKIYALKKLNKLMEKK